MSADRRKRRVWAMIVDDSFRKVIAIGLAVLLWFFIESRIMDSETFTLPLMVDDQTTVLGTKGDSSQFVVFLPSGVARKGFYDGDAVVTTIDVKMSGPRYKIDALKNNPLRLKVMTLLGHQWSRDITNEGDVVAGRESDIKVVQISAADIERDIRYDNIRIELIPSRIRLEVEIQDTITFELNPSRVEFASEGDLTRMRTDAATFSPRHMTLVGPAKVLHGLGKRKQPVFRADFRFGPQDNSAQASLTVIDGPNLGIYPEDGVVSQVTVPLRLERKPYTLNLPLLVRDKRLDQTTRYEPDEKSVPVRVSFAGSLGLVMGGKDTKSRQQWAMQNLRLEVYLNELASGAALGPELQLSPWIMLEGPLLHRYPNNEYRLEESLTVTVRAKQ